MKIAWIDGKLQVEPETDAERDAMLLLWGSARKSRRPGNEIWATDFGAKFDGHTKNGPAMHAAAEAFVIEDDALAGGDAEGRKE